MRADRLLSIIWLLRVHGGLSTAELAERLEVSRRTILRDVEALSAAGVPVYCERGPSGGVRLSPGYRTDVTALTGEESRALFAAVTTWGAQSLGLGDALASGLRKLLAAVPDEHRAASAEVAARIVIDPQGWLPGPDRERLGEVFRTVQEAVFERRRVRLGYRGRGRASARTMTVEPHGLVSSGSTWYLCASRQETIQFYRLSRIDAVEPLPETFEPAPGVDVAAQWRRHRDRFRRGLTPSTVTAWIRDTRWSDAGEWAIGLEQVQPHRPPSEGEWSCVRLEFVDRLHAITVLLRLGADAQVISPPAVRDDLVAHAQGIVDRHR